MQNEKICWIRDVNRIPILVPGNALTVNGDMPFSIFIVRPADNIPHSVESVDVQRAESMFEESTGTRYVATCCRDRLNITNQCIYILSFALLRWERHESRIRSYVGFRYRNARG